MRKVRHQFHFKTRTLLLVLTLTCAAAGAIRILMPPHKRVLVAAHEIDLFTMISKSNVTWQSLPLDVIPDGAITSGEIPLGRFVITKYRKDQPLFLDETISEAEYPSWCAKRFSIPADRQFVYVRPQPPSVSGGILTPGDVVDIVLANSNFESAQRPLASKVRIFCMQYANQGNGFRGSAGLLLTDAQAEAIEELNAADKLDLWLRDDSN